MKNRDQRIDDFLLGKLSPKDAETFEIHAFGCIECLDGLRLREQMIALIKEERVTAVADHVHCRPANLLQAIREFFRLQQNILIHAGAVAVLLIGVFIISLLRHPEAPDLNAANFVEVLTLESKLGQALRSSEFSLSILAPKISENFTGDIAFRWEIKKDGEQFHGPLELKILNNRENPVHVATVAKGQYICQEKLAPGLYYWTLEENGETLYLGKFFVMKSQK